MVSIPQKEALLAEWLHFSIKLGLENSIMTNKDKSGKPDDKPEKPTDKDKKISIHIDKKQYFAPAETMTGAELKALGGVASAYDLFKDVPGQGDDIKIGDTESVHLKNGDHFYSVPKELNPGA